MTKVARRGVLALVTLSGLALLGWRLTRRPTEPAPLEGAHGRGAADPAPHDAGVGAAPEPERPRRPDDDEPRTVAEQRQRMYRRMREELGYDDATLEKVRTIVERTRVVSEGNPEVTRHPMKRSECWDVRERAGLHTPRALAEVRAADARCGARHMVPLHLEDAAGTPALCIDRYEFPNIPCEYPLVHASAREAAELCRAVGKRLCDAHEWEGACAGELRPPEREYLWDRKRRIEMEFFWNQKREKVWAYGPQKRHDRCATGSAKSPGCDGGGWERCGSNTYPAGAFPECVSRFGVYDQHGNAAEHMNLPLKPDELGQRGGLGETEMKGSWFIFARDEAHEDDCRWRAPAWHATRVDDENSHRNYHLGFRCCRDL